MARIRKVQIKREGAGRPSVVEKGIVDSLLFNANMMRQWQIDTDRIATGRSASSYKVIVDRPKNRVTKALGLVSGRIVAAKHTKFALEGRGPGKAPPIHEIEEWLVAKKLKSKTMTRAQLARAISRSISKNGTLPPHFTEPIQTKLTRASTKKMINLIKKPLGQALGRRYVRGIIYPEGTTERQMNILDKKAMAQGRKHARNIPGIEYSSKTVSLTNEELDQIVNPI